MIVDLTLRNSLGFTAHSSFLPYIILENQEFFHLQCRRLRSSVCTYHCNAALSRRCQHCPQSTLFRLSWFFPCNLSSPFKKFINIYGEKSTQCTVCGQIAIKPVSADKGNKQLMIQSMQAPGSIFSPERRKGRGLKENTHKPLLKHTLCLHIYPSMSNCSRRYKYSNI